MSELFGDRLARAVRAVGVPVAVGLDPHLDRLPAVLSGRYEGRSGVAFRREAAQAVLEFGRLVVGAARGRVAAVKPQFAFYEQLGAPGWAALEDTCRACREAGLLVIGDAKRGDISSTAAAYARAIIDPDGPLGCDAVTVNPWMGPDTLHPYLPWCRDAGRGVFALLRTTNPGSARLQLSGNPSAAARLADDLAHLGADLVGASGLSAVGAVVGASAGEEAAAWRNRLPAAWFLVPGVGAQGGTAAGALTGARADGMGALVVASRSVLYPSAPVEGYDQDPAAFVEAAIDRLVASVRSAWNVPGH